MQDLRTAAGNLAFRPVEHIIVHAAETVYLETISVLFAFD